MQLRSNARLAAVQALYQMEAAGAGAESVIREFMAHRLGGDIEGRSLHEADDVFFADIVRGVISFQDRIDPAIELRLARAWTLARLDATARAILRASSFELLSKAHIPARVIIDEYIEIAEAFFGEADRRFVNAVLDALARDLRPHEFERAADGRRT